MAYNVPARRARVEHEIKKSRFIGVADRVCSARHVDDALTAVKNEFPDATHHCWAYILGDPTSSSVVRMNDDGEPSGTAGKPILGVLQHKNVGDVLLVVVRYFGGVKLGAGGLVRAYASTASKTMEQLELAPAIREQAGRVRLDYAEEQPIRRLLDELGVTVTDSTYDDGVELAIRFPEDRARELRDALAERSSGRVKLHAV